MSARRELDRDGTGPQASARGQFVGKSDGVFTQPGPRADMAVARRDRSGAVHPEPSGLADIADGPDSPFRQVANLVACHLDIIATK